MLQPNVPATAAVLAELSRWEQNYVDVAALRSRTEQAERDSEALGEKVALLERRVQVGRRSRRMTAIQTADWLLKVSCMCWQSTAPTLSKRVGGQHHVPASLALAKRPGINVREAGWAWPTRGFEPRTAKNIASLWYPCHPSLIVDCPVCPIYPTFRELTLLPCNV